MNYWEYIREEYRKLDQYHRVSLEGYLDPWSGDIEDNVNSPSHYNNGEIECIDYIKSFLTREEYIGYLRGNIAKYMHRFRYKGKPIEDLKKADWYKAKLNEVIEDD
jgi:hypothetical protein